MEREGPIELRVVSLGADGALSVVDDGDRVALLRAPRGGEAIFVGVRARHLDGCGVALEARAVDLCTGRVIATGHASLDLLAGPDGWGEPARPHDLDAFAELDLCPGGDAARDVDGNDLLVEVTVRDAGGREAHVTRKVGPTCAGDDCARACRIGRRKCPAD